MSAPDLIFGAATIGQGVLTSVDAVSTIFDVLKFSDITRIDTAGRYAGGQSEVLLGEAGAASKHGFTIDTKILIETSPDGTLSEKAIDKSIATSLSRLGTKKINVLHCHSPDPSTPISETALEFHKHYEAGHFSVLGLSNFSSTQIEEWLEISNKNGYIRPTVYQIRYSLIDRDCEAGFQIRDPAAAPLAKNCHPNLLPFLRANGFKINAHSPLASGVLTGKLFSGEDLGGSRLKEGTREGGLVRSLYDKPYYREAVKELEAVGKGHGIGLMELSLRWLMWHSELREGDGIILGASRGEQIKGNAEMIEMGKLPEEVLEVVERAWEGIKAGTIT